VTLEEYYTGLGLPRSAWHVGPEHPALERLALRLLASMRTARILEVGVQAGGFAVPVIAGAAGRPGFTYLGVDNLAYTNAVPLARVAGYLEREGLARGVRFVQCDSTRVLRAAKPGSFDLILLDHYKPKYPIDLREICARGILSEDGAIVLHDVLAHAAAEWAVCRTVCAAFGYRTEIDAGVPGGAAIVRGGVAPHSRSQQALVSGRVVAAWMLHAANLRARRAAGRALRAVGLR
jgi:predicted O-methyltransferase YrrM